MPLVNVVTVYVNAAPQPPGPGVTDTITTPSPVKSNPGATHTLTVDVIDAGVQRPAKGFAFQPFLSGVPVGAPPPNLYRQQDGHPGLKVNELLLEIPAGYPIGTQFTITVQGV